MSPATNSIMGSIPVRQAGVGSAMNDTTRMVGGALGVAVLGSIMNSTYISKIETLNGVLPPALFDLVRSSIQGAHIAAGMIPDAEMARTIVNQANDAFTSGMVDAMLVGAIILATASAVTLIILPTRVRPPREETG